VSLLCLAVDNAVSAVGIFDGATLVQRWVLATDERRTSDEWWLTLSALVERTALEVTGVGISSTVPAVTTTLRQVATDRWGHLPVVLFGAGVRTGLAVHTDNPRDVGTDRVANAVAALDLVGAPCVAVGLGAATTFDVVNAAGQYVGGAIAPGLETSLAALRAGAAQLRQVELVRPRSAIAKNTVEAIQAGALFGCAGAVDAIVRRIAAELGVAGPDLPVVATGDRAPAVVGLCETVTRHEPDLTLHGIRLVFDRNRPAEMP
jgi:type III pantothenate kinase